MLQILLKMKNDLKKFQIQATLQKQLKGDMFFRDLAMTFP